MAVPLRISPEDLEAPGDTYTYDDPELAKFILADQINVAYGVRFGKTLNLEPKITQIPQGEQVQDIAVDPIEGVSIIDNYSFRIGPMIQLNFLCRIEPANLYYRQFVTVGQVAVSIENDVWFWGPREDNYHWILFRITPSGELQALGYWLADDVFFGVVTFPTSKWNDSRIV